MLWRLHIQHLVLFMHTINFIFSPCNMFSLVSTLSPPQCVLFRPFPHHANATKIIHTRGLPHCNVLSKQCVRREENTENTVCGGTFKVSEESWLNLAVQYVPQGQSYPLYLYTYVSGSFFSSVAPVKHHTRLLWASLLSDSWIYDCSLITNTPDLKISDFILGVHE